MPFRYDDQDLLTLRTIAASPEGRRLMELLQRRLDAHDADLRLAQGPSVGWIQGRAQELAELLRDMDSAAAKLQGQDATRQRPAVWQGARSA